VIDVIAEKSMFWINN